MQPKNENAATPFATPHDDGDDGLSFLRIHGLVIPPDQPTIVIPTRMNDDWMRPQQQQRRRRQHAPDVMVEGYFDDYVFDDEPFVRQQQPPGDANADDDTLATASTDDTTNDDDDDDDDATNTEHHHEEEATATEFFPRDHDRNAVWQELERRRRRQPPPLRRLICWWCVVAFLWMMGSVVLDWTGQLQTLLVPPHDTVTVAQLRHHWDGLATTAQTSNSYVVDPSLLAVGNDYLDWKYGKRIASKTNDGQWSCWGLVSNLLSWEEAPPPEQDEPQPMGNLWEGFGTYVWERLLLLPKSTSPPGAKEEDEQKTKKRSLERLPRERSLPPKRSGSKASKK